MNGMNINNFPNSPFTDPKHGTTTIAAKFKDGVVVATDKRASMGTFVASKKAEKLHELNKYTVVTIAGLVSDAQYLVNLTKANLNLYELSRDYPPSTEMAGYLLASIMYEQFRSFFPYYVNMLVCGVDRKGPHVYFLDSSGSISDEDYASTGSGSMIAYGVLESSWKEGMSQKEALKLVVTALKAAISRDTATGDGMDVAIVTKKGIKRLTAKDIEKALTEE
ncbi:MAG: proteasome subunit beta [Candidatus Heimdallarchaeaceae archaeon]